MFLTRSDFSQLTDFSTQVTIAGEKPEEACSLEPQRVCKHVTKLVPQLKEHENCYDVPKEVCTRARTNPRSRVSKLYHGVPPTLSQVLSIYSDWCKDVVLSISLNGQSWSGILLIQIIWLPHARNLRMALTWLFTEKSRSPSWRSGVTLQQKNLASLTSSPWRSLQSVLANVNRFLPPSYSPWL